MRVLWLLRAGLCRRVLCGMWGGAGGWRFRLGLFEVLLRTTPGFAPVGGHTGPGETFDSGSRSGIRPGLLVVDHNPAIANRDFPTGIMVHVYVMALPIEHVHHIVPSGLFVRIVRSDTSLLRRGVGISLLHLLLDLVSCVSAGGGAGKPCDDSRVASAHTAAKESTDHGTETGSYQPVFILDRLCVCDLFVVALLTRIFNRLGKSFGADDFRTGRGSNHAIAGDGANTGRRDAADHQTNCQGLVHYGLSREINNVDAR